MNNRVAKSVGKESPSHALDVAYYNTHSASAVSAFGWQTDVISWILFDGTPSSRAAVKRSVFEFTKHLMFPWSDELDENSESVEFKTTLGAGAFIVTPGNVVVFSLSDDGLNDLLSFPNHRMLTMSFEKFKTLPLAHGVAANSDDEAEVAEYHQTVVGLASDCIRSLDRSALGDVASHEYEFRLAMISLMADVMVEVVDTRTNSIYLSLWDDINQGGFAVEGKAFNYALVEILFWLRQNKDIYPEVREVAEMRFAGMSQADRLKMLDNQLFSTHGHNWMTTMEKCYANPEYVPFVTAGITDFILIEQCVINGIDIETATVMNSARKVVSA